MHSHLVSEGEVLSARSAASEARDNWLLTTFTLNRAVRGSWSPMWRRGARARACAHAAACWRVGYVRVCQGMSGCSGVLSERLEGIEAESGDVRFSVRLWGSAGLIVRDSSQTRASLSRLNRTVCEWFVFSWETEAWSMKQSHICSFFFFFYTNISLCGCQSGSQCLHPTFHCPGQDADRLTGTRCSGNTCVVQDGVCVCVCVWERESVSLCGFAAFYCVCSDIKPCNPASELPVWGKRLKTRLYIWRRVAAVRNWWPRETLWWKQKGLHGTDGDIRPQLELRLHFSVSLGDDGSQVSTRPAAYSRCVRG